jgi:hypothetical protein
MGDPPGASYLRYIYAVQQLDADAAVEHLHRFFDFGGTGDFTVIRDGGVPKVRFDYTVPAEYEFSAIYGKKTA